MAELGITRGMMRRAIIVSLVVGLSDSVISSFLNVTQFSEFGENLILLVAIEAALESGTVKSIGTIGREFHVDEGLHEDLFTSRT